MLEQLKKTKEELFQEEKIMEKKRKVELHGMKPIEIRDGYMDGQFSQL